MKVNGREIKCVVLVNFIIPMEIIMKEHLCKIRHTDKEVCSKLMDRDIQVLGGKTTPVERGYLSIKTIQSMRENLFKDKSMVWVE